MPNSWSARGMAEATLAITRLGHRGDGIADTPAGEVFVPFTLPGETVLADCDGDRARLIEVRSPSPVRAKPLCRHFGTCGGCALQHMAPRAYRAWKRELVVTALAHRGLAPEVAPLVAIDPRSRRRAVLTARRQGKAVTVGYHARLSHRLIDVEECPVLVPAIEAALPALRRVLEPFVPVKDDLRIGITATRNGLDLALEGPARRGPALVARVVDDVRRMGVARLSIAGEPVLTLAEPAIEVDGIAVVPPPFAFLQAVEAAEIALGSRVVAAVGGARQVADLYSGVGTFSLRLARSARVKAVEGDADALTALAAAAARAAGLKPVETLRRDLARMPLAAGELKGFDAVVFDPPRAGAAAQAAEIARSAVPTVVAVSCNPATLARDLRILVEGGFRIDSVTPVDQFLYAPHIEVVARLSRARGGSGG
ncbi:23S rRNA m(5)U-1939 methyltransferase [Tepidamorphus gemmatus]|uniref:23S rRNA m(5)U-1939 methyltransferase n=2 Tax=Tepidamorphus gemmatus TaxID=747076 RepID=A0A4R3M4T0_9HYPH|nr:23S rRNA m(5)U-1939 methyltransferase [Tepidamorphus gemmatus]